MATGERNRSFTNLPVRPAWTMRLKEDDRIDSGRQGACDFKHLGCRDERAFAEQEMRTKTTTMLGYGPEGLAETEVERPFQRQTTKARAAEECEKTQREQLAIAEKFKELEQREHCTAAVLGDLSDGRPNVFELLALWRRATLSFREAARG